jgi:hypothetical protein
LGRKRPAVLGKEGAEAALERGEKTLADILNRANDYDDDSFGGESGGEGALLKDGWVEGVGEGRSDEDNLSFYLRMSEGAGESYECRFAHFQLSIHFSLSYFCCLQTRTVHGELKV